MTTPRQSTEPTVTPGIADIATRAASAKKATKPAQGTESAADVFSRSQLAERTLERRAVEAAIWGMPIVSVDAMRQAFFRDAGGKYNDIVYLSKQADWRFQITTPNAASWYVYIQLNTKNGPIVLDIPPAAGAGLFGSINDAWQKAEADVGPSGSDGGKGGKYAVLPPDYKGVVPADFIAVPMSTYNGYSLLRAIPETTSPPDVAKALELVKKVRVYALAQAASPPPQRHIDIAGKLFDGVAVFDDTFYESLARIVDEEPVQRRDLIAMTDLRSIGIEKGKPFKPDAATRDVLKRAVVEAHAGFVQTTMGLPAFWPGAQWTLPTTPLGSQTGLTFETAEYFAVDERAQLFFLGCGPAKKPGAATVYLTGTKDATGTPLKGDNTYRLRVPPNVPAKQFWAVTVYDVETAAFVREVSRVDLNSYDKAMQRNADGSVDVFFGPKAPPGKEANWIPTAPGKPWLTLFRFYGPDKPLMDKTWKLPDIEKV